jgi:hypothetical protein
MDPNKIKASIFYGRHDPSIFDRWINDMDNFFDWYNLYDNKRVRFAKIQLIGEAQLYWKEVKDYLEMKGKPLISTYCTEMKQKLQEMYLSRSYRNKLLD